MSRISYRSLVPGWSAKPLVSARDRIMGTHRIGESLQLLVRIRLRPSRRLLSRRLVVGRYGQSKVSKWS